MVKQVQEVSPGFKIAIDQKKITGTIAYEIATKDGRVYKIVEFNKLTPRDFAKGLKGEKNFIGFQTNVAKGESVFGKGVSIVTNGKSQTFLRVIRFKPARTVQGQALRLFGFKRAKVIDVLEKSRVVRQKGRITQVISEARLLNIRSANKALAREIAQFDFRLKAAKKLGAERLINPNAVKRIINIERRSNGLKPFTEAEFRQAGTPVITFSSVEALLKKVRISLTKNENLIRLAVKKKEDVVGVAFGKPGIAFPVGIKKVPIKKTPFAKTFGKEPITLADFSKQVRDLGKKARTASSIQIKQISRQITNLKSRLIGSPGSITLALANKLEQPIKVVPGVVPFVTVPSAFGFAGGIFSGRPLTAAEVEELNQPVTTIEDFSIRQNSLISNIPRIDSKLELAQGQIQKLSQDLKTKQEQKISQRSITLTRQQLNNAQRQITTLKQVQKLAQKLKLKQQQIQRKAITQIGVPRLKLPFKPLILPLLITPGIDKKKKPKKVPAIPISKRVGYEAFAKQRGKIIKISKVPVVKKKAGDIAAFFVDRTLSATGLIKKTDKKAQKPKLKVPADYLDKNIRKFRFFKIRKGERIPLKNMFIEKRKFRLDKPNESQTIQKLRKTLLRRIKKPKMKSTLMIIRKKKRRKRK